MAVNIQVRGIGNLWQTLISVEDGNQYGVTVRLNEAHRTYNKPCRAVDSRTGSVVDMRM